MHKTLALLSLALPALAFADVDPRFARLRDSAEPLGSLAAFLDKYIGDCGTTFADPDCKENAKKFRQAATGKKFYMIINEDQVNMLSPGGYSPADGRYVINVAPMFAAGGYAVTHGAPKKTDANGNPLVMYLKVAGQGDEMMNGGSFTRMFSTRALRLQVVFTPQGVWTLPKKGGGKLHGVKAKMDAILISVGRTGAQMGLWLGR